MTHHFHAYDVARILAKAAHAGQTDKAGEPYYGHLVRVAGRVSLFADKTVAFLHDILEDTDLTDMDLIEAGFSRETVDAVLVLTRRDGEAYAAHIERIIKWGSPSALMVKMADLADHLRADSPYPLPADMAARYNAAILRINDVMDQLYAKTGQAKYSATNRPA